MLEQTILEKLIRVIEKHAAEMTKDLIQRLLRDPKTSSYQVLEDQVLYAHIFQLYSHLGKWLLRDSAKGEVSTYYSRLGEKWFEEGFALHEMIQVLVTTKRHIWDTIVEKGIIGTTMELDVAVDLIVFLHRFFDMAIYYTIRGYYKPLGMRIGRPEMAEEP